MASSLVTRFLRTYTAKQFKDSVSEDREKLYLFVGYNRSWANESSPPAPNTQPESINYDPWRYMIAAKKVSTSDVTHAIPRYDWTANTVYRQYDSTNENLFDAPASANTFYVLNSSDNVYKCLYNNRGAQSTVEPTGTTTTSIVTSDGYIWKFLYTISSAEANKFKSAGYMPVKYIETDDASAQWNVQENASNGSIDIILVSNGGSAYISDNNTPDGVSTSTITFGGTASGIDDIYIGSTVFIVSGLGVGQLREVVDYSGSSRQATLNSNWTTTPNTSSEYHVGPKIDIKGNGTEAAAYANVVSGEIIKINMINTGSGYSYANVTISANSGGNATAYPVMSPRGGHGANARDELGGYNVMVNVQLSGDESNTVSTNNDFRMVGLIANPINANGTAANSSVYDLTTKITLSSITGTFVEDERVVDDDSTEAYVVSFANTNATSTEGILSVTNVSNGAIANSGSLTANGGAVGTIASAPTTGELLTNKGDILYILHREKVERAIGQTEDFKITFNF